MKRLLHEMAVFLGLELLEVLRSILGLLAIIVFVAVTYLMFITLSGRVSSVLAVILSCLVGLIASAVPGYFAIRLKNPI